MFTVYFSPQRQDRTSSLVPVLLSFTRLLFLTSSLRIAPLFFCGGVTGQSDCTNARIFISSLELIFYKPCQLVRVCEREHECTSQCFYTVYIPVGFSYTHWSTNERWADVFILVCMCVTKQGFCTILFSLSLFCFFPFLDCWAHRYTLPKGGRPAAKQHTLPRLPVPLSHNSCPVTSCPLRPFS